VKLPAAHTLSDALRSLRQRPGSTAVAGAGLALALAAGLLVALLAMALAALDPSIPEPERVVLLDFKAQIPGQESSWATASPVAFGPMLKARQVPLDLISRTHDDGLDIELGDRMLPAYLLVADPDIVPLLGLKALHGDLRASLGRRDGIAVTLSLVHKLWGELPPEQAMNRQLLSRGRSYTVSAVIPDIDPRSPLGVHDALVGCETERDSFSAADQEAIFPANGRVFARLKLGATAGEVGGWMREAFLASPRYADLPAEWRIGHEAADFRAVTLDALPFEGEAQELRWRLLGAVGGACALLLLMAAFNHMNLQAAGLLQRQRETALRRSLGADGAQLLRLWALEALLPWLVSAALALLLAWWVAPAVANWMGLNSAQPVADPVPATALVGLALAVLVFFPLTLAWPAWMALRRPAAPALQGRTASEGPWGRRVRQGLLSLQLGGALLLLALAAVLAVQQHHLLHMDRGFDTRNRVWLGIQSDPKHLPPIDDFVAALQAHPAVTHWAYNEGRPGRDTQGRQELLVGANRARQVVRVSTVSSRFFDTYGMTLLAGDPRAGGEGERLVIDAKAARKLGFASPQAALGALLRGGGELLQEGQVMRRVVAVVADVKLESARAPALPQAFVISEAMQWDLSIAGTELPALREAVEAAWQAHGPRVPHMLQSADELLAEAYRQEQQLTTLLIAVALLAMGVALLGAYALVADTLRRRRAELVLRRLHGASGWAIAGEVAREFALPLGVAALVALPAAALLGDLYLAGFVDRAEPALGLAMPLAAAAAVTVASVALAVARHLWAALDLQPIEALR
jgi:hypothetical protein